MEKNSFACGDIVLYAKEGLCRVEEIRTQSFGGREMDYYILVPLKRETSVVYVPVDNERLTGRMRHLLREDDIKSVIRNMPDNEDLWTDNERDRKQQFRDVLISGNIDQMMSLLKTLYGHRERQLEKGKKMHQSDENAFKDAEELVFQEFSYVLKKERKEIERMIRDTFA